MNLNGLQWIDEWIKNAEAMHSLLFSLFEFLYKNATFAWK